MSNNALHSIRFSGVVKSASKDSYIDRWVGISIHMVTTVVALKVFVGSYPKNVVNQVRFSLNKKKMFRIVANKINFLFTPKAPQRNHIVWLVGHHSSIISDRARWFEFSFCLAPQGIRCIGNLGNRSYHHLRRRLTFGYGWIIDLVMQPDIIENHFLPCYLSNDIAGSIRSLHSLKEKCELALYRQRRDFQSQFHHPKFKKLISDHMLNTEKLVTKGITAFLPSTKSEWVSAVYL